MSIINLIVDHREHKLNNKINEYLDKNKNNLDYLKYEKKNLDIGDIIIEYLDTKKNLSSQFIIERKTVSDMISSIKDGRYKEQKSRINAYVREQNIKDTVCNFFYILEGYENQYRKQGDEKMLFGSWISLQFRDDINCIRLMDLDETLSFIFRLIDRCNKKITDFFDIFKRKNIKKVSLNTKTETYKLDSEIKISKIDTKNIKNESSNLNNNSDDSNNLNNSNNYSIIENKEINNQAKNELVLFNQEICNNNLIKNQIKQVEIIDKNNSTAIRKEKIKKSKNNKKNKNSKNNKINQNDKLENINQNKFEKINENEINNNINIDLITIEKERRKMELDEYVSTIKSQKKQNMTPDLFQKLILCNIPGVSNSISCQVIEHFTNYKKLVDTICIDFGKNINNDNEEILKDNEEILKDNGEILKDNGEILKDNEEIKKMENVKKIIKDLSNVKLKMGTEKKERNLGPALAKKIFMYLNNIH